MAAPVDYYEDLYEQFRADPSSVHESWRVVFRLVDDLVGDEPRQALSDRATKAADFIRDRGHLLANLDPLARERLDDSQAAGAMAAADWFAAWNGDERLASLYCGALALESAHIDDVTIREGVRALFESRPAQAGDVARQRAFDLLVRAEEFERMLGKRFPTKKRFGVEGADAVVPLLDRILQTAARSGARDVVIGTMHRGRLNLIANVLRKPLDQLLAEVIGAYPLDEPDMPADVPYHLGYDGLVDFGDVSLKVSLTPNPSHLEAVNPVALGRGRARRDEDPQGATLCILLHTDASVIGQGVVAETLQLSDVAGFTVGGVIHIIINNQIGFTTDPSDARSSRYCTGAWKAIETPILHVNGDAVDEVLLAADLAVECRALISKDVVVDLVCYRRNGHNEIDEPRFTQPLEYELIDAHPPASQLYRQRLEADQVIDGEYAERFRASARDSFFACLDAVMAAQASDNVLTLPKTWTPQSAAEPETGIDPPAFEALLSSLATAPADMVLGDKVKRLVEQRGAATRSGVPWALGEALAFGSLLEETRPVRLTGQDVARGAFSHRFFKLTDVVDGRRHTSLSAVAENQARFDIFNSPLSEYAVLGFEYGYSVERRNGLTVWEAQFGDFVNGAQIILDQFIFTAEEKWGQQSNLVVLLPHGLEGQGPEHSSARIERLLQLAAARNVEIAHPSTPANYFHLLRRQALRERRSPLIVLSPKKLLRLPAATSSPDHFFKGQGYQPVIASVLSTPSRVILCSGKLAYELEAQRAERGAEDVAIVRLETLYPLAEEQLVTLFSGWRGASYVWVQEEPSNYGAWSYLDRRLERLLKRAGVDHPVVESVCRPERSSPAGSFHGLHEKDQAALVDAAFAEAGAHLTAVGLKS